MMAVDGPAARALGDLARERWVLATGERLAAAPVGLDAWPEGVKPDFRDVPVGIARTAPAWRGRPEIREVEALYLDAIATARETIYLESQYLASREIGEALAARLTEPQGPEVVIVNPKRAPSWGEQVAMDNARTQIVARLRKADRFDRFRLFAALNDGREIVVHSKVMIVDDRLLRIGSSNLNNRSMGVDTECDLAIEAVPGAANEEETRRAIRQVRDDLVAEHLGASAARFSSAVTRHGSVVRAIEALNGVSQRQLASFPPPRTSKMHEIEHNPLTDPFRPIGSSRLFGRRGGSGRHRWGAIGLSAAAALAGILAFRRWRR
jgi:phospholipase D1/2